MESNMINFKIDHQIVIAKDIQIYLLNLAENIKYINRSIIPMAQIKEISRYKIQHDYYKRLIARSFLYEFLAEHYCITDYELELNQHQKPFLKVNPNIQFSFSYSKDYILIGISKNKKIGVDIEYIDPQTNINKVASVFMCSAEMEYFNSYIDDPLNQRICFFQMFSAKEAIIKAFGTGLYHDVKNLNILDRDQYIYINEKFAYEGLGTWLNQYILSVCYENITNNNER